MALKFKSFSDLVNLMNGKTYKQLPGIDPTIDASIIKSSIASNGAGMVSVQQGIQDAVNQSFPQTADDEFLELHGAINNIVRFPASESVGYGAVTGLITTVVPASTPITYNGNSYLTLADSSVLEYSGGVSLSYSSGIVTAVTDIDHTLSTGLEVTITDSVQTNYNGTFIITVLSENTFTYELEAGILNVDTGVYASEYALLQIESVDTGLNKNVNAGAIMVIDITDLSDDVFV